MGFFTPGSAMQHPRHKRPPLPDCPAGTNPFVWICRTAPKVRDARREIAERERRELDYGRQQDNQPITR